MTAAWKPRNDSLRAQTDTYWRGRPTLYRCYAADGALLYVGVSARIPERIRQHQGSSPWFADVDRIVVKVFRTGMDARAAEISAIRSERPVHNIRYGPDWVEPGTRRRGIARLHTA